ncbi:GNAT family N-acetyltransferase [Brevibacillus brevis]|uniref:GNAT family N-acetyltransferase n=1 Tax=Brevibacillus brevis TaxID=1393 RepID=UPI000E361E57|nr:GNAT family N-acetyltransferase [Brevibacillus brevis]RED30846.1 RimJ/RimL family protein N-acetyltransferase [Brevibacillus brevis]GEC88897.1 alanine acetyltransferase [Brevibacillus brevis]VEF89940.1 Acetyltransferase (GNAT) family [Brevibacillus brevis]
MKVLETDRLILRWQTAEDADFVLKLMNEPSWIRFIGDRGLRTTEDARNYILNGAVAMYESLGFGLYLVALKEGNVPIGLCGLIKRDSLEDVDIGFAYLPAYWGKGYAYEAASAVLAHGKEVVGLKRIVAITNPDNATSANLLKKIGLQEKGMITLPNDTAEVKVFAIEF